MNHSSVLCLRHANFFDFFFFSNIFYRFSLFRIFHLFFHLSFLSYPSDPMRITKKFAGASCIGKQVFQHSNDLSQHEVDLATEELRVLEQSFHLRLVGKEHKKHNYSPSKSSTRKVSYQRSSSKRTRDPRSSRSTAGSNTGAFNEDYYYDCEEENDDWDMDAQSNITSSTSEWLLQSGTARPLHKVMSDSHLTSYKGIRRESRTFRDTNSSNKVSSVFLNLQCHDSGSSGFATLSRSTLKRSFSTMDMAEYEAYAKDDNAAVDLLMKFIRKVKTDSERASPPASYQKEKYAQKMRTYSPFSGEGFREEDDNDKGSTAANTSRERPDDGSVSRGTTSGGDSGSQDDSSEKESGSDSGKDDSGDMDVFTGNNYTSSRQNESPPDTRVYNFEDIKTFNSVSTDRLKVSDHLFDGSKSHDRSTSISSGSKISESDGATSSDTASQN